MHVGSTAYSYRKYLSSGEMSLEEFLHAGVEMGLDGVELTAYYFSTTERSYLHAIKRLCYRLGLDISGTAVGNNFCVPDEAKRAEQVQMVKEWIGHSVELGAACMRVFAGGVPEGHTEAEARQWTIDALKECADYAGERGVLLALENHGGITSTADQVISLIEAVDSEWVVLNLDTGNFRTDPYGSIAQAAPHAVTCHVKTEVPSPTGGKEEADIQRIVSTLRDAGYNGYLSIEYEAAEEPKVAVPRFVAQLKALV